MNKFLIASVALFGLAGVAVAQEAAALYGQNNVSNSDSAQTATPVRALDASTTASVTVTGTDGFNINLSDDYSGK